MRTYHPIESTADITDLFYGQDEDDKTMSGCISLAYRYSTNHNQVGPMGGPGPEIFGKTKTCALSANIQSKSVTIFLDGVLGPPCA